MLRAAPVVQYGDSLHITRPSIEILDCFYKNYRFYILCIFINNSFNSQASQLSSKA